MIVGLCQSRKTALRTLLATFDTAFCFDRNTVCLKDLTFLFIRQHRGDALYKLMIDTDIDIVE